MDFKGAFRALFVLFKYVLIACMAFQIFCNSDMIYSLDRECHYLLLERLKMQKDIDDAHIEILKLRYEVK